MKTYISHLLHPFELGSFIIAVMVGVFALISTPPFYDPAPEEELFLPRIILIFFGFVPYILIALYLRSRAGVEVNNSLRRMRLTILDKTAITIFVLLILMLIIIPLFQQWHSDKMALKRELEQRKQADILAGFNNYAKEACGSTIGQYGYYRGYLNRDNVVGYYYDYNVVALDNANLEQFTCINEFYAHDGITVWFQGVPLEADPGTISNVDSFVNYDRALYAKDAQHVYKSGVAVPAVDPATFTYINHDYYKDARTVYYQGNPIPNADPITYTSVGGDWGLYYKDAERVYVQGKEIQGLAPDKITGAGIEDAIVYDNYSTSRPLFLYNNLLLWKYDFVTIEDPDTLEYVVNDIYKDQYRFYAGSYGSTMFRQRPDDCTSVGDSEYCRKVPDVSELSRNARFIIISDQDYPEGKRLAYIIDNQNVYGLVSPRATGEEFIFVLIEEADAETFELHTIPPYAQDKNSLYWEAERLENSNSLANTYLTAEGLLINGQNVYWQSQFLEGINSNTMRVQKSNDGQKVVVMDGSKIYALRWKCVGGKWFVDHDNLADKTNFDVTEYLTSYIGC